MKLTMLRIGTEPRLTEQYWGETFCHDNSTINDPLFQFTHHSPPLMQQTSLVEEGGMSFEGPGTSNATQKEPTATLISRLYHLQGQLCRLLMSGDGQPGFEYVQEGLEASKSFLDLLQVGSESRDNHLPPLVIHPRSQRTDPSQPTPPESCQGSSSASENGPSSEEQSNSPPTDYIVLQQSLTCYLYVLLLLERVVGVLTKRTGFGDVNVSISQESSTALHLGLFSLASQPALSNEVVMHLILRLVQHLQRIIRMLASRCKEISDNSDEISTSRSSDLKSPGNAMTPPVSLGVVLHGMSDLIVKRENALIARLLSSTGVT